MFCALLKVWMTGQGLKGTVSIVGNCLQFEGNTKNRLKGKLMKKIRQCSTKNICFFSVRILFVFILILTVSSAVAYLTCITGSRVTGELKVLWKPQQWPLQTKPRNILRKTQI